MHQDKNKIKNQLELKIQFQDFAQQEAEQMFSSGDFDKKTNVYGTPRERWKSIEYLLSELHCSGL